MEINEFSNLSSDGELFSCLNQEYFSPSSPLPRTPCELTASIEDLNLTQAFKESNILLTKEASKFKHLYQGSQSQLHETQNKLHETQNQLQKALEEIKLLKKKLEEQSLSSPMSSEVSFSRPPNYRKELPITVPTKKQKVNRPPPPSSLKNEKFANPMPSSSIANPDISSLFSSSFTFDLSKDSEIIKEECIFDGEYSIVPTLPISSDSELMDRALAWINSFPVPEKKPCSKGEHCKDHTLSHTENFIHPVIICVFGDKCECQEASHAIRYSHPLHLQEELPTTTLSLPMVTSPSPSSPDSMIMSPEERSPSGLNIPSSIVQLPLTVPTTIPKRKQQHSKKSTTQKKKNTKNVKKEENCPHCGIKLSRGGFVLKRHISTQHPDKASMEQIKRFPCEECGQVFNTKAAMKRHFQIHSLEKPWKCTLCLKSYSDHVNLKRHLAWHEGTTFQQQKKSVVKG